MINKFLIGYPLCTVHFMNDLSISIVHSANLDNISYLFTANTL
jgi:hypothetical protein